MFQIDELNDWLEDAYKLFILKPTNLSHADRYLLLDWEKIFNFIELKYGDSSVLDTTLLPCESSVDLDASMSQIESKSQSTLQNVYLV